MARYNGDFRKRSFSCLDQFLASPLRLYRTQAGLEIAQVLIDKARPMYAEESLGFDLDSTVYALDSTDKQRAMVREDAVPGTAGIRADIQSFWGPRRMRAPFAQPRSFGLPTRFNCLGVGIDISRLRHS